MKKVVFSSWRTWQLDKTRNCKKLPLIKIVKPAGTDCESNTDIFSVILVDSNSYEVNSETVHFGILRNSSPPSFSSVFVFINS